MCELYKYCNKIIRRTLDNNKNMCKCTLIMQYFKSTVRHYFQVTLNVELHAIIIIY